jgi:hypothetical protein
MPDPTLTVTLESAADGTRQVHLHVAHVPGTLAQRWELVIRLLLKALRLAVTKQCQQITVVSVPAALVSKAALN